MIPTALAVLTAVLALDPPSGRPPMGPLEREDPRVYDVQFEVVLSSYNPEELHRNDGTQTWFELVDTPIALPIVFQSTYAQVEEQSLAAELFLDGAPQKNIDEITRLQAGLPFSTQLAIITVQEFEGVSVRWRMKFRTKVWSSRLASEEAAAQVPWPREWPGEVRDGLKPQAYIESSDDLFRNEVQRITEGRLEQVPPYIAAKELVRHCIKEVQAVGDGNIRSIHNNRKGMRVVGAREAALEGRGSPHDLVCVCVATLRAAGIPARPVVGVMEDEGDRKQFVSWAEFYLPDVGWVPFDPDEMQNRVERMDVRRPWPGFGTMKDMNKRIPLAFHFVPPADVISPRYPAIWGWNPKPTRHMGVEQEVTVSIVGRPVGHEPPVQR